ELKDESPEDLDELLRYSGTHAEEDEERIAAIKRPREVDEIVGTEHQAEVFGKDQGLEPRQEGIFRSVRHRQEGPHEELADHRMLGSRDEKPSHDFVLQDQRRFDERQLRLHEKEQEVAQKVFHLESHRAIEEAREDEGYVEGLDLVRGPGR